MSKLEIYCIYYFIIILAFFWENLLVGNYEARRGQRYGNIRLNKIKKNILFPVIYIKRFTYSILLYQSFNFILFIIMFSIGLFATPKTLISLFRVYLTFQTYYFWLGPLSIAGITSFKDNRKSCKILKARKLKTDEIISILQEMDIETYTTKNATALCVKPHITVKGFIIIISGRVDYTIPDIDYKEFLEYLLSRGYLLLYHQPDSFEEEHTYISGLEEVLTYTRKESCDTDLPVYLIGREGPDMLTMLLLLERWKCVYGMIWLCESRPKKIAKSLQKDLSDHIKKVLESRKHDICIVDINEKYAIKKLDIWLDGNGRA